MKHKKYVLGVKVANNDKIEFFEVNGLKECINIIKEKYVWDDFNDFAQENDLPQEDDFVAGTLYKTVNDRQNTYKVVYGSYCLMIYADYKSINGTDLEDGLRMALQDIELKSHNHLYDELTISYLYNSPYPITSNSDDDDLRLEYEDDGNILFS